MIESLDVSGYEKEGQEARKKQWQAGRVESSKHDIDHPANSKAPSVIQRPIQEARSNPAQDNQVTDLVEPIMKVDTVSRS
jgi:hypothetical protein